MKNEDSKLTITNVTHGHPGFASTEVARVTANGEVFIDWQQAEKAAKAREEGWAFATIMIAIRDGTYKNFGTS